MAICKIFCACGEEILENLRTWKGQQIQFVEAYAICKNCRSHLANLEIREEKKSLVDSGS